MFRFLLTTLLLLLHPHRFTDHPSAITLKLPYTELVNVRVSIGVTVRNPLILRLSLPASWPSFLPVAELRLSRSFAQRPVEMIAEMDVNAHFNTVKNTITDVEKIILGGGAEREVFVRIWARAEGVASKGHSIGETAFVSVVLEKCLLSLPYSTLQILLLCVLLMLVGWRLIVPFLEKYIQQPIIEKTD